jgi:hypothetical protein
MVLKFQTVWVGSFLQCISILKILDYKIYDIQERTKIGILIAK